MSLETLPLARVARVALHILCEMHTWGQKGIGLALHDGNLQTMQFSEPF